MEQALLAKVMPTWENQVRIMRRCHEFKADGASVAFHFIGHVLGDRTIFVFRLLELFYQFVSILFCIVFGFADDDFSGLVHPLLALFIFGP